jgi:DNA mismatch endonuclease (patch repair protein)
VARISRSENMRRIRSKDTRPEMVVRRLLHSLGYRYKLHVRDLPGRPDLVFPSKRKIVLVQGCFWHQHSACIEGRIPNTRRRYWRPKLAGNVTRDRLNSRKLRQLGWRTFTIWECQISNESALQRMLRFLANPRRNSSRKKKDAQKGVSTFELG